MHPAIMDEWPDVNELSNKIHGIYAVHVTHILAVIDALDERHQFLKAGQAYQSWPLILSAWHRIFSFPFFTQATKENWKYVANTSDLEALPSLVEYAHKHWEQWDNREETHKLVQLVKQVCDKLDEEQDRCKETIAPSKRGQNDSFGHQGIPKLGKQIRQLLDANLRNEIRHTLRFVINRYC